MRNKICVTIKYTRCPVIVTVSDVFVFRRMLSLRIELLGNRSTKNINLICLKLEKE